MKKESAAFGISAGINALVYSAVFVLLSWVLKTNGELFFKYTIASVISGISALIVNTVPALRDRRLFSCALMFISAAVSLIIVMDLVTSIFLFISIALALLPPSSLQKKPRPFLISGLGVGIFASLLALFPTGFEIISSQSLLIFSYSEPFVISARLIITAAGIAGSALILRRTFLSGILMFICSAGMFALGLISNSYLLILCGFIFVAASIPALMPERKPQM